MIFCKVRVRVKFLIVRLCKEVLWIKCGGFGIFWLEGFLVVGALLRPKLSISKDQDQLSFPNSKGNFLTFMVDFQIPRSYTFFDIGGLLWPRSTF